MRATSEAVEGNKVRLSVEVDEIEVDDALGKTIRTLSRQARVPGFRPGKVPRQVLEARMGGAVALRAEALREAIPDFYAKALAEVELDPISAPEIDITAGEETGALAFDALVAVRPVVAIPGYQGLRVTVPSPIVSEADVDSQIDRMRETEAELVVVERAARDGDHVTIDLHGSLPGGEDVMASDDVLYEVGSGRAVPGLDEQLRGAKVGDVLSFSAPAPAQASGEPQPDVELRVLVKEIQEKKLPEATDEWAAEASELSTVAELRADVSERLSRVKVVQAQLSLRQAAMSALAELVEDTEVPEDLVEEELRQRVSDLGARLEEQGIGIAQFIELTGRSQEDLVGELRKESQHAVKGDLALRSLAEAESLDATEAELEAEIEAMAARLQLAPPVVRERLTRAGRMAAVRSEQRKAKALAWLLDRVEIVDEEGVPVSRDDLRVDQGSGEDVAEGTGPKEGAGGIGDDAEPSTTTEPGTGVTSGEIEA